MNSTIARQPSGQHTISPPTPGHPVDIEPGEQSWHGWLGLLLEAMITALMVALALTTIVVLAAGAAQAGPLASTSDAGQANHANTTTRPAQRAPTHSAQKHAAQTETASSAALILQTPDGPVAAPLLDTDVELRVTGHVVRATVSQTYSNTQTQWLDGVYQFPLPDNSSVDAMTMRIGERTVVGRIQARQQAKKMFDRARANGQRAALLSQHRPNMFTTRVANIAPSEQITITIEYQQVLALSDQGWLLRFPTVVTPRYSPSTAGDQQRSESTPTIAAAADADARVDTHSEPIQTRIRLLTQAGQVMPKTATQLNPLPASFDTNYVANPIRFRVLIDAGVPITVPQSASHSIRIFSNAPASTSAQNEGNEDTMPAGKSYQVELQSDDLADRDFELQWSPRAGATTAASVQIEKFDGDWYGLLVAAPPTMTQLAQDQSAREMIFVIDTSGSMHGESISQARSALQFGLLQLRPGDQFNIIEFNSTHSTLFARSRPVNEENMAIAQSYLKSLRAQGGTEMFSALERALLPAIPAGLMSQVIFITDGAVSNENALFSAISDMLGSRRLFTVGIGSAPNSYFMREAAVSGRGTFTTISSGGQIRQRMTRLFRQLAHPALTDLQLLTVHGEIADTGTPIRDLYAGEPLNHVFRLQDEPQSLFLQGRKNGKPWQQEIQVRQASQSGLHKLWARAQLSQLAYQIRQLSASARNPKTLRTKATQLAITHHMVSAYTSLLAVDDSRARPAHEASTPTQIKAMRPKGWAAQAVVAQNPGSGRLAAGASSAWEQLLMGSVLLLLALLIGVKLMFIPDRRSTSIQGA